jgi:hypothetical protein
MSGSHTNEDAAAGIFTFVLLFFLCGILFIVVGFGVDKITALASTMYTGINESQLRFETANWMLLVFRAEPLIFLILIGYNFWVSEMRQNSGMADTGTMIIAVAEVITMTFIIIMFTLFGGSALDTVVQFVNTFPVTNPDISLYSAVQYISVCFYGIMFLVLVGILAQFGMTCVRTVDYNTYNTTYG